MQPKSIPNQCHWPGSTIVVVVLVVVMIVVRLGLHASPSGSKVPTLSIIICYLPYSLNNEWLISLDSFFQRNSNSVQIILNFALGFLLITLSYFVLLTHLINAIFIFFLPINNGRSQNCLQVKKIICHLIVSFYAPHPFLLEWSHQQSSEWAMHPACSNSNSYHPPCWSWQSPGGLHTHFLLHKLRLKTLPCILLATLMVPNIWEIT